MDVAQEVLACPAQLDGLPACVQFWLSRPLGVQARFGLRPKETPVFTIGWQAVFQLPPRPGWESVSESLPKFFPVPPEGHLVDHEGNVWRMLVSDAAMTGNGERVALISEVEDKPARRVVSSRSLHSVRCRCDGRGVVPGPHGHAIPCPETEPK